VTVILPPYSGETAACVKCGSTTARTRYEARLDPSGRIQHELRNVLVVDPEQERLCRECGHCGFHWDEATVDADKHEPKDRACHLVHDRGGHEPHTWTDADGNWLNCPGSGTMGQHKTEPCVCCQGRGYVADFSKGLDPVYGEPGKKPCPACQSARPEPSPLTALHEARCLSQFASKDGVVQCREKVGHGTTHQSEAGTNQQMGAPNASYVWKTEAQL
jgi:hypothetical protein